MPMQSQQTLSPRPAHPAAKRPFARLVAHFTSVIINTGQDAGASELNLGIGGILAILAVPGAFISLMLFDKYSTLLGWIRRHPAGDLYLMSVPDKYFFIVFSMVITGMVTVFKWDKILPSRQDYANLAPLPLPSRTIFLANLAAIVVLASVFAVDVNAASTVLFPMVVLAQKQSFVEYLVFAGVHAASVILASTFTFFACFSLMGALMTVLPNRAFRKVSLVVRLLLVLGLITLLCTSFAVPALVAKLPRNPHSLVRYLPPVWFLGVYQSWQGKAGRELRELGDVGLQAAAASFVLALAFSALSYRRYFIRIPESADARQTGRRNRFRNASALLDRFLLKNPFQRACYHFSLRALLRSETHCILFGAFAGLGLVLASQMASADLLAVPLAIAYFVITGLRFVFEVPAGLGANWIYKLILDRRRHEAPAVARKLMLTFLVPGVIAPCLIAYSYAWNYRLGLLHTAYVLALSLLLMELLLLHFQKIPFACTAPLFQNHSIVMVLIYALGFYLFTTTAASIERFLLLQPIRFLGAALFLGLTWAVLRRIKRDISEAESELIFDEVPAAAVQSLNILNTN